jgi:hypothetical protein
MRVRHHDVGLAWFLLSLMAAGCAQRAATAPAPAMSTGATSASGHSASGAAGTLAPAANGGNGSTALAGGRATTAGAGASIGSAGSAAGMPRAGRGGGRAGSPAANGGRGGAGAGTGAGASAAGSAADGGATGAAYKGVANSPCAVRMQLNVSWYYNWEQTEDDPCKSGGGGEFVPMIWGHTGAEQTGSSIQQAVQGFVSRGAQHVLGFNEPDNSSQSNIPVATAIMLWPSFDVAGIQIGSPGTQGNANPGEAWFNDFMKQVNASTALRTDFLAIHWYGWNAGSCDNKASQLESYLKYAEGIAGARPIWITEWGCLNDSATDAATVVTFYKAAIAMFDKHPRLARYAFYPWSTNNELTNKDGTLTELGMAYAAAPAYR